MLNAKSAKCKPAARMQLINKVDDRLDHLLSCDYFGSEINFKCPRKSNKRTKDALCDKMRPSANWPSP